MVKLRELSARMMKSRRKLRKNPEAYNVIFRV